MYLLDSNIIKDNILLLNITKDMGEHQDISWASVELMDYVIKPGSITLPASAFAVAAYVSMRVDRVRKAVLKKYRDMARTHSSTWFKLSSNKEADERGSHASISVEGLRRSADDPASTHLRDMVVIARKYYHALHTPLPDSADRLSSQDALVQEIADCYGGVPAPPPSDQRSGPFSLEEVEALRP